MVGQWKGYSNASPGDVAFQQGPLISIRHPQWTRAHPRQDIPIMIFTPSQWHSLQHEEFHVSPAPIGPSELDGTAGTCLLSPRALISHFPPGRKR
jgi:hypothetical protein